MGLTLVTAPASEPLTPAQAKAQLRVDFSDDDTYITDLIKAAREYVETTELSSALITQIWDLTLDAFPATPFKIPRPPLQSITSITYTDIGGSPDTVDASVYLAEITSWPGRLFLKDGQSWPSVTLKEAGGVVIRFVAGYGDAASDVPTPIVQALKLIIADWYENRENAPVVVGATNPIVLPFAARQLLASYRRRVF